MILRTANGSLMKVTEMEGQRMLDEHPFDYFYESDACEICVKIRWTTCEVKYPNRKNPPTIRMCCVCFKKEGGTDDQWDKFVDEEMKRIDARMKEYVGVDIGCGMQVNK